MHTINYQLLLKDINGNWIALCYIVLFSSWGGLEQLSRQIILVEGGWGRGGLQYLKWYQRKSGGQWLYTCSPKSRVQSSLTKTSEHNFGIREITG